MENADKKDHEADPVIGLALSGGGSRVIAFHLGCLRALHDRGVLDKIQVISSVSGGSVIAAAYVYWRCSFAEFDSRIVELLRRGFQGRILAAAIAGREAPKVMFTLFVSGGITLALSCVRWALSLARSILGLPRMKIEQSLEELAARIPYLGSLTTAFEHVLSQERLFGATPITAVVRTGCDVVINACDLRTGTACRFGNRASGGWRYGRVDGAREIPVAKAVAASAAYPLTGSSIISASRFLSPTAKPISA